jgi:hypothetical protein
MFLDGSLHKGSNRQRRVADQTEIRYLNKGARKLEVEILLAWKAEARWWSKLLTIANLVWKLNSRDGSNNWNPQIKTSIITKWIRAIEGQVGPERSNNKSVRSFYWGTI